MGGFFLCLGRAKDIPLTPFAQAQGYPQGGMISLGGRIQCCGPSRLRLSRGHPRPTKRCSGLLKTGEELKQEGSSWFLRAGNSVGDGGNNEEAFKNASSFINHTQLKTIFQCFFIVIGWPVTVCTYYLEVTEVTILLKFPQAFYISLISGFHLYFERSKLHWGKIFS